MANSSKGSVVRSAAPNTNSPFRTRPKHVKLSPCPIEISPQHRTNSLDANVARRGILQQATFMRTMNHLFSDILDRGVVAFMDDVLIYSSTIEEHEQLLKAVFSRLQEK